MNEIFQGEWEISGSAKSMTIPLSCKLEILKLFGSSIFMVKEEKIKN